MKQVEGDRFLSGRAPSHFASSLPPLLFPLLLTFPASNFPLPLLPMFLLNPHTFSLPLSWFLEHVNFNNLVIRHCVFWNRWFIADWNLFSASVNGILQCELGCFIIATFRKKNNDILSRTPLGQNSENSQFFLYHLDVPDRWWQIC